MHPRCSSIANTGSLNSESVDLWAAGCVLYTMLAGYQPFYRQYVSELIEAIKLAEFDFAAPVWAVVSPEAKDLITQLLQRDPTLRPSSSSAINHAWLRDIARTPSGRPNPNLWAVSGPSLQQNKRRLTRGHRTEEIDSQTPPYKNKRISFNHMVKNFCAEDRREDSAFSLAELEREFDAMILASQARQPSDKKDS